ncbi:MAG: hypothetical protein ACT4QE_09645 [Anaerolineales bacterium]
MMAPQVAPEKLVSALQHEMQEYLQSVMQAVNQAPDGEWIAGSEEQVRNLSADFRRKAFEKAMQLKIDAAEAAFPPSAQRRDEQASGQ